MGYFSAFFFKYSSEDISAARAVVEALAVMVTSTEWWFIYEKSSYLPQVR